MTTIHKVAIAGRPYEVVENDDGTFSLPLELENLRPLGTALKPSFENILCAQKALHSDTPYVEANGTKEDGEILRLSTTPPPVVPKFIYAAKASRNERNAGLDGLPEKEMTRYSEQGQGPPAQQTPRKPVSQTNVHPTVKSLSVLRKLCAAVTGPGETILDPFLGSGTTAVAAILEGRNWIGCEMTEDHWPIIEGRVAWAEAQIQSPDNSDESTTI